MRARMQMGRVGRVHRRHVAAGRCNRSRHPVMSAAIDATTAGPLLLLHGRHRWPLLVLLLVLVLMLRRHR